MKFLDPYTLPTIDIVGGETLPLVFNAYQFENKSEFDLQDCVANFAVINYTTRRSTPVIDKEMSVEFNDSGTLQTKLTVKLVPEDTLNLHGKYIYQITVVNAAGDVESMQGIMFVYDNINKNYLK